MPIRPELKALYPPDWPLISAHIRFVRAGGRCERCGRPHGETVRIVPGGRWLDVRIGGWRSQRGAPVASPDLLELLDARETRVVLAAAHLDHNPAHNSLRNLRALCQRCHLLHDRVYHARQRRLTWLRRSALGDLFEGPYCTGLSGMNTGAAPASRPRRPPFGEEKRMMSRA